MPDWLNYGQETLTLFGTPGNDDVGNHYFRLNLTDNNGEVVDDVYGRIWFPNQFEQVNLSEVFSITVDNVNDAPVFNFSAPSSTNEDAGFSYQLTAEDIDANVTNETLTYEAVNKT